MRRPLVVVAAVLLVAAAALSACVLAATVLVRANVVTLLSIESASMEPVLKPGDLLVSTEVNATEVQKDDLVTVEADGTFVTHRAVYVGEADGSRRVPLTLKGDANEIVDSRTYAVQTALSPQLVVSGGAAPITALTSSPVPQIALGTVLCVITLVLLAARADRRATAEAVAQREREEVGSDA